jgi:PhoPQ-activated pathogenicity-related protein
MLKNALLLLLLTASMAFAQNDSPQFHLKMLLDGRFIVTGKSKAGWMVHLVKGDMAETVMIHRHCFDWLNLQCLFQLH